MNNKTTRSSSALYRAWRLGAGAGLAAILALFAGTALAVQPGAMSIYSKVGQSFSADIQISDLEGISADDVEIKVLPQAAYAQLGMPYDPILDSIRMNLTKINSDSGIIQVNSVVPYNNSSINLLLEISYSGDGRSGQKIFEYSGILDPTFLDRIAEDPPSIALLQSLSPEETLDKQLLSAHVETAPGDTWSNLAQAIKQAYLRNSDISQEQIMMALRARNPELFQSGSQVEVDANLLVLLPNQAQLRAQSPASAEAQVAAIDQQYLESVRQPGRVRRGSAPLSTSAETRVANNAAVRAAAQNAASSSPAPASPQDIVLERVELVTQLTDPNLRDQISGVYEEIDKNRLEGSDLRARAALLDKQAADLEKLVQFKSQQLALLEQNFQQRLEEEQRRQALPRFQTRTFMDIVTDKVLERPLFWLMLAIGLGLLLMMVLFVILSMRSYQNNVRQARRDQLILDERKQRAERAAPENQDTRKRGSRILSKRGAKSDEEESQDDAAARQQPGVYRRGPLMGDMVAGVSRRSRVQPPQGEPYKLELPDILQLTAEHSERQIEERQSSAQMRSISQDYLTPGNNIVKVNLDLALAYINMRQYDEARGLLNQVLKDGSKEEVQRAQLLLNEMARKETRAA